MNIINRCLIISLLITHYAFAQSETILTNSMP